MEIKVLVAHHGEKLQIARAAEKVGILVETKGNTLEAAVECASWRSAGLDRALKIDRSGKTSHTIFRTVESQSPRSLLEESTQNDPKMAKFSLLPAVRYLDTLRGEAPEPRK